VIRPHVSLGSIAAEEELDTATLHHDEAGRLTPVAIEGKAEHVAVVLGGFDEVVDEEADGDGVQIAFLPGFIWHGKSPVVTDVDVRRMRPAPVAAARPKRRARASGEVRF